MKNLSKKKQGPKSSQSIEPGERKGEVPAASTLFRFKNLDASTREQLRRTASKLKPLLWIRDGASVQRIERAQTPEAVLDLVPEASGLAEDAWFNQMRRFGPEALPLVSGRLRAAGEIPDEEARQFIYDRLIAELRWRGQTGALVLLGNFDALDDYGKSQACTALGLTGVPQDAYQEAAGKIWQFYQKTAQDPKSSDFVGALWGLLGLKDPRLSQALVDRLQQRKYFYELFGLLSIAGDAGAVFPLVMEAVERPAEEKNQAMMALVSIAHRIGREALIGELAQGAPEDEPREELVKMADHLLSLPASAAHEVFGLFYRGLSSQVVSDVLEEISLE